MPNLSHVGGGHFRSERRSHGVVDRQAASQNVQFSDWKASADHAQASTTYQDTYSAVPSNSNTVNRQYGVPSSFDPKPAAPQGSGVGTALKEKLPERSPGISTGNDLARIHRFGNN